MIRQKLKQLGYAVWQFFSPTDPARNFAGHAVVAFLFSYVFTLSLGTNAGAASGISVYAFNEIQNLGSEIAEDREIDWKDHIKDFFAAAPGTALGIIAAHLTLVLVRALTG